LLGALIVVALTIVASMATQQLKRADEERAGLITYKSDVFPLEFKYPDYLQIENNIFGENIIEGTDINSLANITIKDDKRRVFFVSAYGLDMLGNVMLYIIDAEEILVDGKKAMKVKKEDMKGEFEFFVQTIVEFPNFFYIFLSDGENPLYDEILSTVRFLE